MGLNCYKIVTKLLTGFENEIQLSAILCQMKMKLGANLLQIYEVIIYILQNYEQVVTIVLRHSNTITRLLSGC